MQFTSRGDIEAPIEFVFERITDFASFERSIMRRGGDVERLAENDAAAVGTRWNVRFQMRGKERDVTAEITEIDAPNGTTIGITSKNIDGTTLVELVALSKARTRLMVKVDVSAKTIPAKLFFQSLRLARQKSVARFKALVAGFAEDVEAKYRD